MKRACFAAFAVLFALTTPARAAGPAGSITKGPWLQHVTSTSAVVRVEVDPPAPVRLEVSLSESDTPADAGASTVIESREARRLHSILVKGLEPSTRYPVIVRTGASRKFGAITTAPRADSTEPFHFLVYGDNRSDDAAHAAVVVAMTSREGSFLVNTGDVVERGDSAAQWQRFFDIEAPLTRERPIFSAVGNHELTDKAGVDFVRYLGPAAVPKDALAPATSLTGVVLEPGPPLTLAELNGTFRWSNARFFMLNGMVPFTSGPTREWLEKVLADSDAEPGLVWRIVVVHHGPWSSGPHGDNKLLQDAKIPDLLRAHKVDLVISGHDHIYERGSAGGLAYLVSGGAGAPVYRVKKAEKSSRRYESVHHFVEASVSPVAIQIVAIRPDGSTLEECTLAKGQGWTCDAGDGGAETAAAPAGPMSRCGCKVAGERGSRSDATSLLTTLVVAFAALLARRVRARSMR